MSFFLNLFLRRDVQVHANHSGGPARSISLCHLASGQYGSVVPVLSTQSEVGLKLILGSFNNLVYQGLNALDVVGVEKTQKGVVVSRQLVWIVPEQTRGRRVDEQRRSHRPRRLGRVALLVGERSGAELA